MNSLSNSLRSIICFCKQPYNLVFLIAWGSVLLGFWRGVNNHIPVLKYFTDELEWIIVLIPIILSINKIGRSLRNTDICFFFVCITYYILSYIIFPDNSIPLTDHFFTFACLALPYYFIGVGVDVKKFIKPFFYVSIVSLLLCVFYEFSYLHNSGARMELDTSDYNMDLAYNMLPHVLLITWIALKELKLWQIPLMLLGFIMILSLGTRGPLLCLILFVAVYLFFFKQSKHQKFLRVITLSITMLAISFLEEFMLIMQSIMVQLGMSTRIFDKYFEGEVTSSTGRDYISDTLFRVLNNGSNIGGYGILGSYRFVDTYPHNLLLDFWFSFGWLLGSLLLIILLFIFIKALLTCKDEINKVFLLLLFCGSIVKLMLSSTFIDDSLFFLFVGFCVQSLRRKNPIQNI